MDEGDIDHARYGWGAEEWVHDSQIVVEETTRRNMSVSFTSGTNWSNANLPTIDPDHPAAAKELDLVSEDLPGGTSRSGALPRIDLAAEPAARHLPGQRGVIRTQTLVAVVAVRVLEETEVGAILDVDSVVELTEQVQDEALEWTAPDVRHLAAVRVLDARHRPDRLPVRLDQLHRQLRRPGRRPGRHRLLGLGGAHT